jgi:hypothetical protein
MSDPKFVVYLDGGRKVGCESAAAVAELLAVLDGSGRKVHGPKPTARNGPKGVSVVARPARGGAFLRLLEIVRDAGTAGVSSAALARALGVSGRALGTIVVNGAKSLGDLPITEVVARTGPAGDKHWTQGARIGEAIRALSPEDGRELSPEEGDER